MGFGSHKGILDCLIVAPGAPLT
eukprot:COSAG02_NODE_59150_length_275_cov_0.585227_1_plen_22_part_10